MEDIQTFQIADDIEEESPDRLIASGLNEMIEDLSEIYSPALLLIEYE